MLLWNTAAFIGEHRVLNGNQSLGVLNHVDGFWVYLVLFLLILVQECGIPFPVLPSEVVLLGGGFMASQNRISLVVAGILVTIATLIGNSTLYFLGRHFGRSLLDRYGKYIHLRPDRVDRIEDWVSRRGTPILLYGPLIPLMRAYVPAIAGIFGVPFRYYVTILTFAAVFWSFGLLIVGEQLGNSWFDAVSDLRHNVRVGVIIGAVVLAIAGLIVRWRRHRAALAAQKWEEETAKQPDSHL